MVVEADESDGTFIRLPTEIGVVTNIDPEHLDYYGTEAALHEAFLTFFRQIPENGLAVPGHRSSRRAQPPQPPRCGRTASADRRRSGARSMRSHGSTTSSRMADR